MRRDCALQIAGHNAKDGIPTTALYHITQLAANFMPLDFLQNSLEKDLQVLFACHWKTDGLCDNEFAFAIYATNPTILDSFPGCHLENMVFFKIVVGFMLCSVEVLIKYKKTLGKR